MGRLHYVFFTKDRPMQFRAFVESFCFYANDKYIDVILPCSKDYEDIQMDFPNLNFIYEYKGFDKTLRSHILHMDNGDNILFGCDDQIYTRFVNTMMASLFLDQSPDHIGFSLRLGTNIEPRPLNISSAPLIYSWNWRNSPSHYGYPFELMGTIYRVPFLKELVNAIQDEMMCPNFYEYFGVNYCWQNQSLPGRMAMFNGPNYTVVQDVNRVQDYFPNGVRTNRDLSAEKLKAQYREGKRLAWGKLFNIIPKDCFVGDHYWETI